MTSGLATDDPWADRHLDMTPDELDAVCAAGPWFAKRPGDGFEYSNLGFGLIGRVVERVTGRRVRQHVTERLLEPLGMRRTTWVQPAHDDWARPHLVRDGAAVADPMAPLGDGEIAPMGGLWSTVADLTIWSTWLADAVRRPDAADWVGLQPASRCEMQRQHAYIGIVTPFGIRIANGYGFGLQVRQDANLGRMVTHSGGLPGYGSNMLWAVVRGVAVIALANVTYAPMADLTMQLLVELHRHGVLQAEPAPDAPLLLEASSRLVELLSSWSDETATVLFADNVALDESFDRRSAAARAIVARHGALELVRVEPVTAARGVAVARGTTSGAEVRIDLLLAPLAGGPVQRYSVVETTAAPT